MSNKELQLQTAAFRLEVKKRSDKLINYFLVSYFLLGLILASFYDTWGVALGAGGICLLAYYSVKKALPGSNLYQYVLGVVFGIFMAQFIYQMHGLFEMHFFAFIGSAILITYQNWKLQIAMLLVVVVHHVAFGYLQNSGIENVYFTQLDYFELRTFIIHFVLAAVIFFICGLWGYQLKKSSEKQIRLSIEMTKLQKEALYVQELAVLKENLEREKYYLDSLMDNMPDSIYFKDKESRLMRVSKYMAEHFNTTVDDLIGKSDFDFQHELHAKEAYDDEQHIQKTKTPKIDYVEKETNQNGSICWVTTTKMPLLNAAGQVVGTFGMSRDITNVKRLEEERHAAELDKAVAQGKFEIASDVMHDIGNAVVGFGSYLTRIRRLQDQDKLENLQGLAHFFTENKEIIATGFGEAKAGALIKMLAGIALTQRSNQEEVSESISEQLNIITHIQEILNIQRQYISGHESQERKPVNLNTIINDSISMVFASIDKLDIGVSLEIAPDLPIIKGDRTKLMQAILNILKNSIEAIDKNSSVKTISLNAFTKVDELILQIKDSGGGFDESTANQLFQRGFSTKLSGSGLGLYNCRSIIESHEGTIAITSEGPGRGSVTTLGFKI
ncbi:MAG: ATP-binding protein [Chitinophagaceae bacterium]